MGANDTLVQATITFGAGNVGLVSRYGNELNWLMAWFDDSRDETPGTGDILLAQVVDGTFTILQQSVGVNWTATGTDRTLSLNTDGEDIIVKLDGIEIISATSTDLATSTIVGIFSRASTTNAFEDFTVSLPPLTAE